MGPDETGGGGRSHRSRAPFAVLLLVLVAAAALVLPRWPTGHPTSSAPTSSATSSAPTTSAPFRGPASSAATPSSGGGEWARIALPAYAPIADLVATTSDAAGVAADSTFALTSLDGEPPTSLAARLTVDPVVEVQVSSEGEKAIVRPASPLQAGGMYRFSLNAPDGSLQGSWVFQVKQPLHVAGTLPADQQTGVPLDTGIEVTFDQAGISRSASYFAIQPAVPGTFQIVGRVLAFAPSALQPRTVYRVTIHRGLPVDASDQVLEKDVTFAFETEAPGVAETSPTLRFPRRVYESSTSEAPILTVNTDDGSANGPAPRDLSGSVYRFPDLARALVGLASVENAPTWMRWQHPDVLATSGLQRVSTFTVRAGPLGGGWGAVLWFQLPAALPAGWYLVDIPGDGRPMQAFIQVTDVATYLSALSDRTVLWVHDLATGGPLAGASVDVSGAGSLGRTDERGLLIATTPAALAKPPAYNTPASALATVTIRAADGRTGVVAGSMWRDDEPGYGRWGYAYGDGSGSTDDNWQIFHTDRTTYRQTDTINVFGLVRARDTGAIPPGLVVRLISGDGWDPVHALPAIVERKVTPTSSGVFATSIPYRALPEGWYLVELRDGNERAAVEGVSISVIRKPAYQLSLTADRQVYLVGDPIHLTATATFYDGTPVRGLALAVQGTKTTLTTNASGVASATITATMDSPGQGTWSNFTVRPVRPEEGDLSASTGVVVDASSVYLDATTRFVGAQVSVAGNASERDLSGAEQPGGSALDRYDAHGASAPGTVVQATAVGHIPVATRTGETYDFIAKKVVPVYSYDTKDVPLGTQRVTADGSGAFRLTLSVGDPQIKACTVTLTAVDAAGRVTTLETYDTWTEASTSAGSTEEVEPRTWGATATTPNHACLEVDGPEATSGQCSWQGSADYAVGDQVQVVLREDRGALPVAPDAYLFLVEQRGLRQVIVQDSPHLAITYDASAVPNVWLSAVRFAGSTYQAAPDGFLASLDKEQRALDVTVSPDATRYRPGDTISLDVSTVVHGDGRPTAATVVLSAVDQKLYDMYAAYDIDPLDELYAVVDSGLRLGYASHQYPAVTGGGSTAGGGDGGASLREEFLDSALFRRVTTSAEGRATITFKLPDDLTSWHVTAYAMTGALQAGSATIAVPVSLPFFADVSVAPEYLVGDRPSISLRAQGDALRAGDRVTFTVTSETLGMAARTVSAPAFGVAEMALPPLRGGTQKIVVRAAADTGAGVLTDALARTFEVVTARVTREQSATTALGADFRPTGGAGMTTYTFSDAGRGRFLSLLRELAWDDGPRLEQALAASEARTILARSFPGLAIDAPPPTFESGAYEKYDSSKYNLTLVSELPYASGDLELTVRALLAAPDAFDAAQYRAALPNLVSDRTTTPEQKLLALVGMAAVGSPVLGDLRAAAAAPDATPVLRLYTALGLAALGDDAGTRAVERDLIATYGERYGSLVRLHVSDDPSEMSEATSLLAELAAGLGDPVADQAETYVERNPSSTTLLSLQQLGYVRRAIEHASGTGARFAYAVDGRRTERTLSAGESWSLRLTAAQRASFSAEALSGSVVVTTTWRAPLDAAATQPDPTLAVTRFVAPAGVVPSEAVVDVRFGVTIAGMATSGCSLLTEAVPSGLVPLAWSTDQPEATDANQYTWPWRVEGQRVDWYVCDPTHPPRYLARVLTAGGYEWEPAVLQPWFAPDRIAVTSPATVTIR